MLPANEIKDPELRALQERNQYDLKNLGAEILAPPPPTSFLPQPQTVTMQESMLFLGLQPVQDQTGPFGMEETELIRHYQPLAQSLVSNLGNN